MDTPQPTMAVQPSAEEVLLLKDKVFLAAKVNQPQVIQDCLASLDPDVVKDVLHHCSTYEDLQATPLIIAASKGHLEVVELLVSEYQVDVNQTILGNLWKCNALFSAVLHGYLDVVKVLVRNGCDVNAKNKFRQTVLFSACMRNDLNIVKFLVESGALVEYTSFDGGLTCLMRACKVRNWEMAKYLLSKGADPNKQDFDGRTALHTAAEKDASDIIALLFHHGARFTKDKYGRSPLMDAAKNRSTNAMNIFLQSVDLSQTEKIEAFELLGARLAATNVDEAFRYLRQAMEERYKNPHDVHLKPYSPLPTLSNVQESQTLEELQARQSDRHLFRLECLAIVGRILGPENYYTMQTFIEYFKALKSSGRHHDATTTLLHGMKAGWAGRKTILDVSHDMGHFLANFAEMLKKDMSAFFPDVEEVLKLTIDILEKKKQHLNFLSDSELSICLNHILLALKVSQGQDEGRRLQRLVERFVRLTSGCPLLHTAVGCRWHSPLCFSTVEDLPYTSLVSFLVYCGADVHFKDDEKNTALHTVAFLSHDGKYPDLLSLMTKALLRAGALPGVENDKGQTALDLAAPTLAAELRELYPVSLKSLAASVVVRRTVLYDDEIPQDLMEFVQKH